MAGFIVYTILLTSLPKRCLSRAMGRAKRFPHRIVLSLSDELLTGIDRLRHDGEGRLSLIRSAIEAELRRRSPEVETILAAQPDHETN